MASISSAYNFVRSHDLLLTGQVHHQANDFPATHRWLRLSSSLFTKAVEIKTDDDGRFSREIQLNLQNLPLRDFEQKVYTITIEILAKSLDSKYQSFYAPIETKQMNITVSFSYEDGKWDMKYKGEKKNTFTRDIFLPISTAFAQMQNPVNPPPLYRHKITLVSVLMAACRFISSYIPLSWLFLRANVIQWLFNLVIPSKIQAEKPTLSSATLENFIQNIPPTEINKEEKTTYWEMTFGKRDPKKTLKEIEIPDVKIVKNSDRIFISYRFDPSADWSGIEEDSTGRMDPTWQMHIHYAMCAAFLKREIHYHALFQIVHIFSKYFFTYIPEEHPLYKLMAPLFLGHILNPQGINPHFKLINLAPIDPEGLKELLQKHMDHLIDFKEFMHIGNIQNKCYKNFCKQFDKKLPNTSNIIAYENWQNIYYWSEAIKADLPKFSGFTNQRNYSSDEELNNLIKAMATLATYITSYKRDYKIAFWSDVVKTHVKKVLSGDPFNPLAGNPAAVAELLAAAYHLDQLPPLPYTIENAPLHTLPKELKEELFRNDDGLIKKLVHVIA